MTRCEQTREKKPVLRRVVRRPRRPRVIDGPPEIALHIAPLGATGRSVGSQTGLGERFERLLVLFIGSEPCHSDGFFAQLFLVEFETLRQGFPSRRCRRIARLCLDQGGGAENTDVITAQPTRRLDLQPRHAQVAQLRILHRFRR